MLKFPIWKKARSLGFSLLENQKEFSKGKKRVTPPGQHGKSRKRKPSIYAQQNQEKQKVRFLYHLKQKQLYNLFKDLKSKKGDTRFALLSNLESRLVNVIFRSGLTSTRLLTRQWISHGHFLVNDKKVDRPNYLIEPGDIISLKEKYRSNELIKNQLQQINKTPAYLILDKEKTEITYLRYPSNEELEEALNINNRGFKSIKVSLVTGWYNKKI